MKTFLFGCVQWGIHLCFAHNGEIPKYYSSKDDAPSFQDKLYQPLGDTDSEAFFCDMLNYLATEFPSSPPSKTDLYETVHQFCTRIAYEHDYIILNFLLSFGENVVLAYSWPGKRPEGKVWNGLHYALRRRLNHGVEDIAAIVSTKPLSEGLDNACDEWIEMKRNQLILFERGIPHASNPTTTLVHDISRLRESIESTAKVVLEDRACKLICNMMPVVRFTAI